MFLILIVYTRSQTNRMFPKHLIVISINIRHMHRVKPHCLLQLIRIIIRNFLHNTRLNRVSRYRRSIPIVRYIKRISIIRIQFDMFRNIKFQTGSCRKLMDTFLSFCSSIQQHRIKSITNGIIIFQRIISSRTIWIHWCITG